MTIGKLQPKLGIWQFKMTVRARDYDRLAFRPHIALSLLRLKHVPEPGWMIQRKDYDGILWYIPLWPDTLSWYQYTVHRPNWLHPILKYDFYRITLPWPPRKKS